MPDQNNSNQLVVVEGEQVETTTEEYKILNTLGFCDTTSTVKKNKLKLDVQLPEEFEKYKHELKITVANGTVKDFISRHLTYEELDSLSPKQLKKYYKLYTEKKNAMTASSLSDAFVDGITILGNKAISIDDIDSYTNYLKNDFLTSNGINHIVGMVASCIGQPLGLCPASIIIVKHMESKTSEKQAEPSNLMTTMAATC